MLHPLSLFPNLFSYPFLAYFILRIVVTYAILRIGAMRWKSVYKYLAIADFVAGILVLVGLYTQGALILVMLLIIKEWYINSQTAPLTGDERFILCTIFTLAFALMFLGAGAFALDYPL